MRRLLPVLILSACAEAPSLDARIPAAERAAPPAALVPLGGVLAATDALPAVPAFEPALRSAAADLGARARALPGAAAPDPALAARLEDLAARTEGLAAPDPALAGRVEELATRTESLAAPTPESEAQRLAELEARAEALRAGGLTEAERERLDAGPSLP